MDVLPNAALVIDGVDCGQGRRGKVGVGHDLMSDLNHTGSYSRLQFTRLNYQDFTLGTLPKVERVVRALFTRLAPEAIFVTGGTGVQMTGEYHGNVVKGLSAELGIPVLSFASKALSGEFLDGFSDLLVAGVEALSLGSVPKEPGSVAVVGLPLTRNESDGTANVAEVQRLLVSAGVNPLVIFPSGRPLSELAAMARAETVLSMPHGEVAAALVANTTGARLVTLPLPVGLEGTASWLRAVAKVVGTEQKAEAFISDELKRCVPRLHRVVRSSFAGQGVLLAAETNLRHGPGPGSVRAWIPRGRRGPPDS